MEDKIGDEMESTSGDPADISEGVATPPDLPAGTPTLAAHILRVTVSEDRAEIRRSTRLDYRAGRGVVFIPDITLYAHDASLNARIESGENSPEVGAARIVRWYQAPEQDYRKKEQEFLELLDKLIAAIHARGDEQEVANLGKKTLARSLKASRTSILRDVAHRADEPYSYREQLDTLLQRLEKFQDSDLKRKNELRDLLERVNILYRDAEGDPGLIRKRAGILVHFEASAPGSGILTLGYEVPCSQWRPKHEAHLAPDGESVRMITHGMVWQNTGEDWKDVELTLSTARPSLGLDLTLPGPDQLKLRDKTEEERKTVKVQMRDQIVKDTGPERDEGPGVPDDGGQTQNFTAPGKVSIPADGEPYQVELTRFESAAESRFTAAPELSDRVFQRSLLRSGPNPILAGPVDLYRNGGFVGRAFLDFVGAGDSFYLDWGSDDFIQLSRKEESEEEEAGMVSKAKRIYTVEIIVYNLNNHALEFELTERLPVSEIESVEVKLDEAPGDTIPDADGFMKVNVDMRPQSERKLVFKYRLVMDKNVKL